MDFLIVEDGTGVAGANTYITPEFFYRYLRSHNLAVPDMSDDELASALVRGSEGLDGLYAGRWPGIQVRPGVQGLAWGRREVYVGGLLLAPSPLPSAVMRGAAEAAWREAGSPGALLPDRDLSQQVISESVGSLSLTYAAPQAGSSGSTMTFPAIDAILADLVNQQGGQKYGSFYLRRA